MWSRSAARLVATIALKSKEFQHLANVPSALVRRCYCKFNAIFVLQGDILLKTDRSFR